MQKFFRGQRVKIAKELPTCMSHFKSDLEAIIDHSYTDIYSSGNKNAPEYSVLLLDKSNTPINRTSWYPESTLTLVDNNRNMGELLLQMFKEMLNG